MRGWLPWRSAQAAAANQDFKIGPRGTCGFYFLLSRAIPEALEKHRLLPEAQSRITRISITGQRFTMLARVNVKIRIAEATMQPEIK